jgi:hypothetical protein
MSEFTTFINHSRQTLLFQFIAVLEDGGAGRPAWPYISFSDQTATIGREITVKSVDQFLSSSALDSTSEGISTQTVTFSQLWVLAGNYRCYKY